jgi:hypothetical protein
MPDKDNLSPQEKIQYARDALGSSDVAGAAAYASLASVELLEEFLTLAREGLAYQWSAVEMPGGGMFTCACGSQAFTEYPTTSGLPYVICGTPDCSAVWNLGEEDDPPHPPRRVVPFRDREPAWQVNDMVRHRNRYATPIGDHEADLVALLQRPHEDRPGWWQAMVLRSDPITGVIVGQSITLNERGKNNRVARFPD